MSSLSQNFALRPLEIKHLFDFAIRLLRSGFAPMFLATAMVQLPLTVLTLPLLIQLMSLLYEVQAMGEEQNSDFLNASFWYSKLDLAVFAFIMLFVALAYQVLITPLGNLICARLAACRLLGIPCTFAEAWAFAKLRYWPTQVAIAIFLLPLLLLSLLILVIVLIAQTVGSESGVVAAAGFGIMFISLGSMALSVYFCIYFPAINGIIQATEEPEGRGALAQGIWCLKRAGALTRSYFWRMFGFLLLLSFIINQLTRGITESIQLLLALVSAFLAGKSGWDGLANSLTGTPSTWEIGLTLVVASVFSLIFPPYWQCFKTLLYYDLRCRKDGFDLLRSLGLPGGRIAGESGTGTAPSQS